MPVESLSPGSLCRPCDPSKLGFSSTAELSDGDVPLGQQRAMDAVRFGADIRREGYNIFALGPPGLGKQHNIRRLLEARAAKEPPGSDWCYVHNFEQPQKPRCVRLAPGRGAVLRDDVAALVDGLKARLPAAFESDEYRGRVRALDKLNEDRRETAFREVKSRTEARGVGIVRSPSGFALVPIKAGSLVDPQEFDRLPEEEKQRFRGAIEAAQAELQAFMESLPALEHEHHKQVRELNRSVAQTTAENLAADLRGRYADVPAVLCYLDALQRDVVESTQLFLGSGNESDENLPSPVRRAVGEPRALERYQVNVLVDHTGALGAPVVYEDRTGVGHLVGRVEHRQYFGALVTDFTLIKKGALHEANGGYLLLDVLRVLMQPYAWEELKRALRTRSLRIESVTDLLGLSTTATLEPEAIPLDVKVVLMGDRRLYDLLSHLDPEFPELFKVAADFAEDLDRTEDQDRDFARLIASIARQEKLRALDAPAVARVIELASRRAGDSQKLTAHTRLLADVLRESDYWAGQAGHEVTSHADVERALEAQEHRLDRVRERIYEEVRRGTLMVSHRGEAVGQVNGLAVLRQGELDFGYPVRITARTRLGKGEIVDIEREATLGGPIHSKGVLILSGFLGARYAPDRPFSLSASVVFEQSYGPVEGDSASAAELFALLSSLGEVPVRQGLAVTGSVDQHGRIQPIGGVNEKIEGFFDVCRDGGLTGDQGVLIPRANVKHLMLRRDVVRAVEERQFGIWAIETVDQGLELLSGQPAGERGADGTFPKGSVNGRVAGRLQTLAERARAFLSDKSRE